MLKRFFTALALCGICLLPNAAQAQGPVISYQYTVLRSSPKKPDKTLPNIHPRIEEAKDNYVMVSVQEEDLLRVAFYGSDLTKTFLKRFDVHNPTLRNFTGMPAQYLTGVDYGGVVFADDTILKPYLPSDAQPIGTSEWPYEMRWRRAYKNYYLVTVYRGAGVVCFDELVTEKDGQDISLALGETSVNADLKKFHASWGGDTISMSNYIRQGDKILETRSLTLIKVTEKDLPPDFPKGLVRWIP